MSSLLWGKCARWALALMEGGDVDARVGGVGSGSQVNAVGDGGSGTVATSLRSVPICCYIRTCLLRRPRLCLR